MLALRDLHRQRGAHFTENSGSEAVLHYGAPAAEYAALTNSLALFDLSQRGRLAILGPDRLKFLHGQLTNDVQNLGPGSGCYAALVNHKAKMESDLWIYRLAEELLLDFEPGLTERVTQRLERFVIADDVQIVDVSPHYGLLSLQGPLAAKAVESLLESIPAPGAIQPWQGEFPEAYLANRSRFGQPGFDFYIPTSSLPAAFQFLADVAARHGGALAGFEAAETARIESAIPRFGQDMDETTLPPEAGLERSAISYNKGCYIGQEIIARIRTYGQVAKKLRALKIVGADPAQLPKGLKILSGPKEVGFITSATFSPKFQAIAALGYIRREVSSDTELMLAGLPGARAQLLT